MILYVRTVFLVVRTIRLICPNVHSSCPDDNVFATSTWHYVRTSLKFRPDGEPYRVKSLSPRAAAHFLASFCVFIFVILCVFFSYILCIVLTCTCRLWILSPSQVYSCTLLLIYFKLSMIKIGCVWVSTILSLICIIPQNLLLVGLRLCLFGSP
jgi:hypothetical protein